MYDLEQEVQELRRIVSAAERVVPQYREHNKQLKQQLFDERVTRQTEQSAHQAEVERLSGQLSDANIEIQRLQRYQTLYENQQRQTASIEESCAFYKQLCKMLAFTFVLIVFILVFFVFPAPPVDYPEPAASAVPAATKQTARPTATPSPRPYISRSLSASAANDAPSVYSTQEEEYYVWIVRSGKRYHDSKKCSSMSNPVMVTLSEAKRLGFTPCGNCKPRH